MKKYYGNDNVKFSDLFKEEAEYPSTFGTNIALILLSPVLLLWAVLFICYAVLSDLIKGKAVKR